MDLLEICDKTATLPHEIKRMIFKYMSHTTADLVRQFNDDLNSSKLKNFIKGITTIRCKKSNDKIPSYFTGGYFMVNNTIWNNNYDVYEHKFFSLRKFWRNNLVGYDERNLTLIDYKNKLYGTIRIHPDSHKGYSVVKYYDKWSKKDLIKLAEQNNIKIKKNKKKKDLITALIKN